MGTSVFIATHSLARGSRRHTRAKPTGGESCFVAASKLITCAACGPKLNAFFRTSIGWRKTVHFLSVDISQFSVFFFHHLDTYPHIQYSCTRYKIILRVSLLSLSLQPPPPPPLHLFPIPLQIAVPLSPS